MLPPPRFALRGQADGGRLAVTPAPQESYPCYDPPREVDGDRRLNDLHKLTHYTAWANAAWIEFIHERCPFDEFLLTRMSHILLGEQAWFQRIADDPVERDVWNRLTIPQLRDLLGRHREIYDALLGGDLTRIVGYKRFTGEEYRSPVSDILVHLSHHGAHHRGQMATHASSVGVTPLNTDFIQFCLANRL